MQFFTSKPVSRRIVAFKHEGMAFVIFEVLVKTFLKAFLRTISAFDNADSVIGERTLQESVEHIL